MCNLCDENEDMQSCQDCGHLICFDEKYDGRKAYVTESGDLFCWNCGSSHDLAEEYEDE